MSVTGLDLKGDVSSICAAIADQVVPAFRVTRKSSCTGWTAKRWSAAYEAARISFSVAALRKPESAVTQ